MKNDNSSNIGQGWIMGKPSYPIGSNCDEQQPANSLLGMSLLGTAGSGKTERVIGTTDNHLQLVTLS
jgi:hypothetical protein